MDEASVPCAKQDPRLNRYVLRRLVVPVAGGALRLVVPDAREWLRRGAGGSLECRDVGWEPPYWLQVWPAAVAISRVVAGVECSGLRIVDLGCGIGLPGVTAAARRGQVMFVDREPDAVAFATWNANRAVSGAMVRHQLLDWSANLVEGAYDLALLADVSYRPMHHGPLQRQIASCLAPGGAVLHADPMRPESVPFLAWLRSSFRTVEAEREVHHAGKLVRVRLCLAVSDGSEGAGPGAGWIQDLEARMVKVPRRKDQE